MFISLLKNLCIQRTLTLIVHIFSSNVWPPNSRQPQSSQFYAQQPAVQPVPIHHIHGSRKESSKKISYGLRHPPHQRIPPHQRDPPGGHPHPHAHAHFSQLHTVSVNNNVKQKKSSSSLASRFPSQISADQLLKQQQEQEKQQQDPTSLDLSNYKDKYRVVQRLLPDVSILPKLVDTDDHAYSSFECCHDLNNNSTEATHSGISS